MMLSGNEARCILMRTTLRRSWRVIALVMTTVLLAIGATTTMAATAVAPATVAPINDNYLDALNLNEPSTPHHRGTPLNRTETLRDERNTTAATVQSDILSPQPGPAELTGCNGVTEGKTIWYDFYPNANGLVRIRTSASFGTVMAVMPYNPTTLLPENEQRKCAVNQPTAAGELFANVEAGKPYTIQLGGIESAGGNLEFLFDYVVQLKRLQAEATLTAQPLTNGVRIVSLAVSAPKKARVEVRCTRGCRPQAKTARSLGFPGLRGAVLPNGGALKIYVTAKNEIGAYIEYKIAHANFTKIQRCLAPGSKKPERCE
jgi:hypothetical protein